MTVPSLWLPTLIAAVAVLLASSAIHTVLSLQKAKKRPVAIMTVLPNEPLSIGTSLATWFVFSLVVGWSAAAVSRLAVTNGAGAAEAFLAVGAVSFATYWIALLKVSRWRQQSWSSRLHTMANALVYGLLTGGVFGWIWL